MTQVSRAPRAAAVWAVAALAGVASAQPGQHEGSPMPPARPGPLRFSAPGGGTDGPFGVQMNTAANGMNILGDAANEPSMTIDPAAPNRIAVGWRQFDSVSSNFRQSGSAYSLDGGRHWVNRGVLHPGVFGSDPVLVCTSEGEFFYDTLLESETACDLFESGDRGMTWNGPEGALGGDKEWMAVDRTGGIGHGNIYLLWSPFFSCCGPGIFGRSTDGGVTFGSAIPVPDSPFFGTVAVGPDGEVYFAGVSNTNSALMSVAKSTNAQDRAVTPTFPQSRQVNLGGPLRYNTGAGPNPGGFNGQVWVAVDHSSGPSRGYVYLLCTVDPAGTDPGDVMFARSTDGGNTWSLPVRVNDDPAGPNNWQWMGTMSVAPSGRIDTVWIDTRDSQTVNLGRLYYSYSTDAGMTWSANAPLTPQWNSWIGWPQQNKIGDYYTLISDRVGANLVYAATFNGEQDVYFLRIGGYDCNGNGIPDSTDIASGLSTDCNGNGIPDECEIAAGIPVPCACYANCDQSTTPPILNVNDFICFQSLLASGNTVANCDQSTTPPILNINDFICFQQRFAAGCP